MDGAAEYFLESVERAMAVLTSFDAQHRSRTLSEVAAATGLTRASARRILLTLRDLGYVEHAGRMFSLAPRVLDYGFAYLSTVGAAAADPEMSALSEIIQESVMLAVLDGEQVRYVGRANGPRTFHLNVPVGAHSPAHVTSAGRILLANLPNEERERYLATAEIQRYTAWTITDRVKLAEQLDEAKARGWAYSESELDVGQCGVGVLIPGTRFALSSVFPITRVPRESIEDKIVRPLSAAAGRLGGVMRFA